MMKKTTLVRIICIILAAAMIIGSGFYLVYLVADADSPNVAYGADAKTNEDAYEKLGNLMLIIQTIEANYKEKIDVSKLVDAAYDGVFDSLDPWSDYFASADEEEEFIKSVENQSYCGVGITMQEKSDGVRITAIHPNGSAIEKGVKVNDIIIKVDGVDVKGWSSDRIAEKVRGNANTTVKLTVLRQGQSLEFTLTRKELSVPSITYQILDGNIAYVDIDNFNWGEANEFSAMLDYIDSVGVKKIIFDLRNNPGGYANEALNSAAMVSNVGETLIRYQQQGKDVDTVTVVGDATAEPNNYQMVLLINEDTVSAAEIMAIALKGNGHAKVVGVTSYGKGVVQQIYTLSNGDSMKISTAYYVGPKNEVVDGVGIKPDYIVYNGAQLSNEEIAEIEKNTIPMDEGVKYVKKNAYGRNVLAAQQRLRAMGYNVTVNGILDETTISCLSDVQKNAGLGTYGMLDFSTIKALEQQYQSFLYGNSDAQLEKAIELLK